MAWFLLLFGLILVYLVVTLRFGNVTKVLFTGSSGK